MAGPVSMQELAARLTDPFIRRHDEVVALGLGPVRRQAIAVVAPCWRRLRRVGDGYRFVFDFTSL